MTVPILVTKLAISSSVMLRRMSGFLLSRASAIARLAWVSFIQLVLFIDEVEEIAGTRQPRPVSAAQGVTNEMLKLIPPFLEQDDRLLICATNSVRALDSAFLRHGRFDYVIPVGPPDPAAREAIWDRYLAAIPHGELDMAAIVEESRLFTRPTSNSPRAGPRSWPSSASCSSTARSR
jgi:hypothetical protein